MKKVELSLREIIALYNKINGDEHTSGIIDRDLTMVERFWVNDLNDKLHKICGGVRNLRDDMVRRRGKPDSDGNVSIKATEEIEIVVDGQTRKTVAYTPEFLKFQHDYNELLEEGYVLSYNPIISQILGIVAASGD